MLLLVVNKGFLCVTSALDNQRCSHNVEMLIMNIHK